MRDLLIALSVAFLLCLACVSQARSVKEFDGDLNEYGNVEPYAEAPYASAPEGSPAWASEEDDGRRNSHAMALKSDVMRGRLAIRTDRALANLIRLSVNELERHGYYGDAFNIRLQFEMQWQGYLSRHTVSGKFRDIGDHKPLSEWLTKVYNTIETKLTEELGAEAALKVMRALRITDIKTFNHTIPVVFNPCNTAEWDVDEYMKHFHGDGKLMGLIPVVGYWLSFGVCQAATLGTGWLLVCSPIGFACEYAVHRWVSYDLGFMVYYNVCD